VSTASFLKKEKRENVYLHAFGVWVLHEKGEREKCFGQVDRKSVHLERREENINVQRHKRENNLRGQTFNLHLHFQWLVCGG
jgi:hypothetical protein